MRGWVKAAVTLGLVVGLLSSALAVARYGASHVILFPAAYDISGYAVRGAEPALFYGGSAEVVQTAEGRSAVYARKEKARSIVVYFHGNAETAAFKPYTVHALMERLDVEVLVAEYPGYGDEEGKPSLEGLRAEAPAFVKLAARLRPDLPIVVWGTSIGGYAAMGAAAQGGVGGLVLDSAPVSVLAVAETLLPRLLFHALVPDAYNLSNIALCDVVRRNGLRTLVIHSPVDKVVPYAHGMLFAKRCGGELLPKEGGHNGSPFNAYNLAKIRDLLEGGGAKSLPSIAEEEEEEEVE